MQIAGIQKCSMVDWPGKIVAALFTPGCNFNCSYCHNRMLLGDEDAVRTLDSAEVAAWLERRAGLLDGVVVSGGEATLQPDLAGFIETVRAMGYPVKLDTNGSRPGVLRALTGVGLVDYVAMDVKAPDHLYDEVTGTKTDQAAIGESIRVLLEGETDYEFRTTVLPYFKHNDVRAIGERIKGAQRYVLQQYQPPANRNQLQIEGTLHSAEWFQEAVENVKPLVVDCETRGVSELTFSHAAVA